MIISNNYSHDVYIIKHNKDSFESHWRSKIQTTNILVYASTWLQGCRESKLSFKFEVMIFNFHFGRDIGKKVRNTLRNELNKFCIIVIITKKLPKDFFTDTRTPSIQFSRVSVFSLSEQYKSKTRSSFSPLSAIFFKFWPSSILQ